MHTNVTNTVGASSQGYELLEVILVHLQGNIDIHVHIAYFPFKYSTDKRRIRDNKIGFIMRRILLEYSKNQGDLNKRKEDI